MSRQLISPAVTLYITHDSRHPCPGGTKATDHAQLDHWRSGLAGVGVSGDLRRQPFACPYSRLVLSRGSDPGFVDPLLFFNEHAG